MTRPKAAAMCSRRSSAVLLLWKNMWVTFGARTKISWKVVGEWSVNPVKRNRLRRGKSTDGSITAGMAGKPLNRVSSTS